jgi:hypothetical protein
MIMQTQEQMRVEKKEILKYAIKRHRGFDRKLCACVLPAFLVDSHPGVWVLN